MTAPHRAALLAFAMAVGLVVGAPGVPVDMPPVAAAAPGPAPTATESSRVWHRRPLRAPVVDRFRLPDGPFGAGNRGWEYATSPGTPVAATAGGTVTFAGPVAGNLHVSVLHADGVRSTYSYLSALLVEVGHEVAAGQALGRSTQRFQIGFLRGSTYLDPATRFVPLVVRLVPDARFPGEGAQ